MGGDRPFEQREQHLASMELAMLAGTPDREVIASAVNQFKVSRSTARRDCLLIRLRWERHAATEREELLAQFGKSVMRLDALFKRALKVAEKADAADDGCQDQLAAIATAMRIDKERRELFGIAPGCEPPKKLSRPQAREGLPANPRRVLELFPEEPPDDTLTLLPPEEAALVKLPEDAPQPRR